VPVVEVEAVEVGVVAAGPGGEVAGPGGVADQRAGVVGDQAAQPRRVGEQRRCEPFGEVKRWRGSALVRGVVGDQGEQCGQVVRSDGAYGGHLSIFSREVGRRPEG
jgi:hypothetical protein